MKSATRTVETRIWALGVPRIQQAPREHAKATQDIQRLDPLGANQLGLYENSRRKGDSVATHLLGKKKKKTNKYKSANQHNTYSSPLLPVYQPQAPGAVPIPV